MKKIIYFFLIILLLCSCSKDYLFKKHQISISNDLKKIKNSDQTVRRYESLVHYKYNIRSFYTVSDSLYQEHLKGNENEYFDFSGIPSIETQINKFPDTKIVKYNTEIEAGEKLMRYVDEINFNKLYQIIKKYGYPSYYNRDWIDTTEVRVGVTYVLTHISEDNILSKKILKLMLKEYFKGRVAEGEMKHYLWNIEGRREDRPYNYVIDKDYWRKKMNEN